MRPFSSYQNVCMLGGLKDFSKSDVEANAYFNKFIVSLLGLFSTDKQLLEDRGSFIIRYEKYTISGIPNSFNGWKIPNIYVSKIKILGRQLCVLLSAKAIYRTISEILLNEDNCKFATVMVETLNTILLTSSELFELRTQLKELKTRVKSFSNTQNVLFSMTESAYNNTSITQESCSLFCCLYHTWSHDPVAIVALCLLTQNYGHACDIIRTL